MMQILDQAKEQRIPPLFRLAFRPFFLAGSAFSVIAMVIWAMFWSGTVNLSGWMYDNPIWWHSHEMLFGFTGAIIVGFLLTAVQNWTGNPGVRGWRLAIIFCCWLVARLGLLFSSPGWVWMAFDLLWMPLAAYFLAKPIVLRKQWNNLFFSPLILLLTYLNARFHLIALGMSDDNVHHVSMVAIVAISVIVLVVGGRVIPFFTWRGTQTEQITRITWLERAALIPCWLLLACVLLPIPVAIREVALPGLLAATAVFNLLRFLRWRTWSTLGVPLLWLLHFAYLFMILGLLLLAGQQITGATSYSVALHFLTVGGIGAMILAMIARVSLGHTGRPLQIRRWMVAGFVLMMCSALVRTLLLMIFPTLAISSYMVSALLWACAFGIFTVVYYPILTRPRLDGRPG
ncbi:NnrS family protein [Photobacterium sp. MCCC 1A19761]|uniref:NnrS family protein n=1 Tax=Photobacterium sp. MCCC 1A19761 TaxID=3115000 RepID=UPI00307D6216